MDNKGGQWGGLAPKQVVQCPRLGAGPAGKAVLDAEGLLGPFSCFLNAGSLQTLVTAGQAPARGRVAGLLAPEQGLAHTCWAVGTGRTKQAACLGLGSGAEPFLAPHMSEALTRGFLGPEAS